MIKKTKKSSGNSTSDGLDKDLPITFSESDIFPWLLLKPEQSESLNEKIVLFYKYR